ncbi:MAG: type II 3-dehydroquinate dehydratase [Gemmatimonadetes bacterium]|nr:type II 3-dehydroquinate dehydratase [Gemmatimonadota bacterium]NIR80891.1 type II 3-dehydroquinate dehydratase [Gemmatimonadota bacterium]NIT89711.1 type II 3-dehydroquinate dehydratase [Gemmatimonadota bacterium]NIU33494.1 type II 3-dehydroquinate dehydratase [Gemmatimonadota bacterium]NIU37773.1 type II 3-dehydroquinate dehydratase [Gemmatimonadota bacterium]
MRIAVVHGPNLQLLGRREPDVYGAATLTTVDEAVSQLAEDLDVEVESFQSNHEGQLLDYVAEAGERVDGFLVNAGGLTHTSVSLRDGLVGVGRPFVEVHLSNTAAREDFRSASLLAPVALGVVAGFGPRSYLLGLRALVGHLTEEGAGS